MAVHFSLLKRLLFLGVAVGALFTYIIVLHPESTVREQQVTVDIPTLTQKDLLYGFHPDSFFIEENILRPNQILGEILAQAGVAYRLIDQVARKAEDVFSVRQLRHGNKFAVVRRDSCSPASYFIYEPDPFRYVLYGFENEPDVRIVEREVESKTQTASGIIMNSLWVSMEESGYDYGLISRMEDALAWSVDFHHIQKGDAYKLIFEEQYVEGKPVGIGKLLGAWFKSGNATIYSVYYETEKYKGFYDPQGRPMKRAFLKAPVKYSRISSRYSRRRYHPVLKTYRGHYGTDYAAGYGTPIVTVADGTISKASYTSGNGNYIKIRHDQTYETQYLHMQRFAKGIRPGVRVKQGQTIGYVGSTGLATGPHVCFRFWKKGRQVDHLRENLPPPDPLPDDEIQDYFKVSKEMIAHLDEIPENTMETDPVEAMLPAAP